MNSIRELHRERHDFALSAVALQGHFQQMVGDSRVDVRTVHELVEHLRKLRLRIDCLAYRIRRFVVRLKVELAVFVL